MKVRKLIGSRMAGLMLAIAYIIYVAGAVLPAASWAKEAGQAPADISRILSIGGDVTEILYVLGVADKIVALDSTSKFPPEAMKDKKVVGYMRALSTEGVLSTNPSIIIASESAGPPEVVKVLKQSSVPYMEIKDDTSVHGVVEKIRAIGGIIGRKEQAETLAKSIEAEFEALEKARASIAAPARALFVLSVQNGRTTVGGKGTSADAILALAGAKNAAAEIDGFKPVSDEQLTEMAPDAVVVMRRGGGAHMGSESVMALKGLQGSPAAKAGRLVEMDALYLLGFGPRAPAAARDLMKALYPEASTAKPD